MDDQGVSQFEALTRTLNQSGPEMDQAPEGGRVGSAAPGTRQELHSPPPALPINWGSQQWRLMRRALRDGATIEQAAEAGDMSVFEARALAKLDADRAPLPPEAFELLKPIKSEGASMLATVTPAALPSLVRAASQRLASAENSAEILDARDMASVAYDAAKSAARIARAKQAHDEIISTVYRAQADALEIESMAKRRLADEYDAAQERGEVRTRSDNQHASSEREEAVSAADLGLSHKEIHEARLVRDAERNDPGVVRRSINDRLAAGKEPNKAALREAVVEAAKQGLAPDRRDRRNAEFVDDPAYRTLLLILGPARAMIEKVDAGEIEIDAALRGFLDGGQRDRAIRDIARARDFLTAFLEAANAD